MLRFTARLTIWLVPFLLYAASPFATAWVLRESIKDGNAATVDRLIEWDSVRITLRKSMINLALDRPMMTSLTDETPLMSRSELGLWQRFKGYMGTNAVDGLIDRYANAQGLPKLFTYGQAYRRIVKGEVEPEKTLANLPERFWKFWSRIRHVEFLTPTVFEIEMEDKTDSTRRFTGVFEFQDWRWKLTELYVHTAQNPLGRIASVQAARNPQER